MGQKANDIRLTRHAALQQVRRSFEDKGIELLRDFGTARHCGRGCESYSFDRKSWSKASKILGNDLARLERYRHAYIVFSGDGAVVTMAWRH